MKIQSVVVTGAATLLLCATQMFAQTSQSANVEVADNANPTPAASNAAPAPQTTAAAASPAPDQHKIGSVDVTVNWRFRVEDWNWFQGATGNSDYPLEHSLLRVGIGQHRENFDWFLEGAQVMVVGLPDNAVVAAPQGQLGLGGSYFAANGNNTNNFNGFLKQGYINLKHLGPASLKIGRFEYFDGAEVKPKDPLLATVINTRVVSRLISNFAFTAVQRSFDGGALSFNSGSNNLTIMAARPTEGVLQVDGMGELDVDTYYGAYTHSVKGKDSSGELRVFAIGYVDHRTLTLKTDNRPTPAKAADHDKIEIGTYGVDYAHVFHTTGGNFDLVGWGVVQTGQWGVLQQHAAAYFAEAGWQPKVKILKPWLSAGYSYGSGDGNPNDNRHGTFFQILTTPRQYARFPFYNMMNNKDLYTTLNLKPTSKLTIRSEGHDLKLASSSDLWYNGGGAFQAQTFGYQGRPSNGRSYLATVWDLSADYQVTKMLTATAYYGHAAGGNVISAIYPKDPNGSLFYFETNFHF